MAAGGTERRDWLRTVGVAFVFWTGIELWTQVVSATRGSPLPSRYIPGHVLGILIACAFSLAGYAALRRVGEASTPLRVLATVLVVVISAPLFAATMPVIHLVTPMLRSDNGYSLQRYLAESLYWLTPFTFSALAMMGLEGARRERARDAALSDALIAAREAELRALHYQVNPHFLYNALNSIATLILDGRNAQAEAMVLRLSQFFRATLTRDPLAAVRLADEVAQQRLYLEIEEQRFPDCLRVVVDVPPELAAAEVPSLILQPLVENAVKHGLHAPGRETRIAIVARAEGRSLVLQVSDNGPGGAGASGTGLGIANVRKRLAARFGAAARVEAGPDPDCGYVATISLPLRFAAA